VEEQFAAVVVDTMPAQAAAVLQREAAHLNLVVTADIPVLSTLRLLMAVAADNKAVADMAAVAADTGKLV
jgi:hypothetical protein